MVNQNQGGGQNSGGNQGGQNQKKPPNFPKCPQCGTRPLPKDKPACLVCQPEYRIEVDLTRGEKKWQILVQTYENNVQANVSFVVDITGQNAVIVKHDGKKYWKDNGVAIIPLEFASKARKTGFHVIGGPANLRELEVPAEKVDGFKLVKPDKSQSFLANLLKGLNG